MNIPIYTVHDNFITSGKNIDLLGEIYVKVLCNFYKNPMLAINF